MLSLDLDNFKPVNDTHGHAVGDRVLQIIARRLELAVRVGDVVLRVGGDEFVVLCFDIDPAETDALAKRVRRGVAEPVVVDGTEVSVGASIGIAKGTVGTPGLLEAADAALYEAKGAGPNTVRFAQARPG